MTSRRFDAGALAPLLLPIFGLYLPLVLWWSGLEWGADRDDLAMWSGFGDLLTDTFLYAGGAALLAGVLGFTQALVIEGYALRGRRVWSTLLLLPFVVPPAAWTTAVHVCVAGTSLLFLARGLTGAIFLAGVQLAPIVLWGTARAIRSIPTAERDALRMHFSPTVGIVRILLPRTAGTALRMTGLVFLLAFPQLEIPGYTGVRTVGFRILSTFTAAERDAEGMLLVGICTLVALVPLAIATWAMRRSAPAPVGDDVPLPAGRAPLGVIVVLAAYTALVLTPFLNLIDSAFATEAGTVPLHARAFAYELPRALLLGIAVTLLGWRLAEPSQVGPGGVGRRRVWPAALFVIPLFLPGSLPGLALASETQQWLPASWIEYPILLSLAQATRFAGVGWVLGCLAWQSIPRAEWEAARLLPPARARWRIALPRSLPALGTAVLIVTALILGEVESTMLLLPPGYTSPVRDLHDFLHFRYDENAAAVALVLAVVGLVIASVVSRPPRR